MTYTTYSRHFHVKRAGMSRYTGLAAATLAAYRSKHDNAPPGVVADLGSSIGALLRALAAECGCATVGVDHDIDPADLVFNGAYADVNIETTSTLSTPLSKADLVVCQEVLEHVTNYQNGLALIDTLAKTHGSMLVFGAARPGQRGTHHVTFKTKPEWAQLLSPFGWKLSKIATHAYADTLRQCGVGSCWLANTMCFVR